MEPFVVAITLSPMDPWAYAFVVRKVPNDGNVSAQLSDCRHGPTVTGPHAYHDASCLFRKRFVLNSAMTACKSHQEKPVCYPIRPSCKQH